MNGPDTWHRRLPAASLGLVFVVVLAATGCRTESWQFSHVEPFGGQPVAMQPAYAGTRHEVRSPVIRAQYSADAGRSVPPLFSGTSPTRIRPASNTGGPVPGETSSPQGTLGGGTSGNPLPPSGGGVAALSSPAYGSQQPLVGSQAPYGGYGPAGPVFPVRDGPDEFSPIGNDMEWDEPTRFIPLAPTLQETQTGRLMFGVGINSDAGLVASVVIDEQNFDWTRFPRSWEDIRNGTAWRGRGQRFRLEAVPGTEVQRYIASFTEPYLLNTQVSLSLRGHYYTRFYREWDEERVGGQIVLGYHFTHALTGSFAYRGAKIGIFDVFKPTPAELAEVEGDSSLHGFKLSLAHDTRDSAFLATEGHLIEASFEQVVGSFVYPRGTLDMRRYFLLHQRPDGSGRHVLSINGRMAVTGGDTPIYEHYYAGGFSTIRGFDFRGASPRDPGTGVIVGGHFMLLASAEYLFPITADDMLRGVIFCDTGTVEPSIDNWTDEYRVSPGFGLRIMIPAMGPAPIALDFAFPAVNNGGDRIENFSFFIGFAR